MQSKVTTHQQEQSNDDSIDLYDQLESYFNPYCFIQQNHQLDSLYFYDKPQRDVSLYYQQKYLKGFLLEQTEEQIEVVKQQQQVFSNFQIETQQDAQNQLLKKKQMSAGSMYLQSLEKQVQKSKSFKPISKASLMNGNYQIVGNETEKTPFTQAKSQRQLLCSYVNRRSSQNKRREGNGLSNIYQFPMSSSPDGTSQPGSSQNIVGFQSLIPSSPLKPRSSQTFYNQKMQNQDEKRVNFTPQKKRVFNLDLSSQKPKTARDSLLSRHHQLRTSYRESRENGKEKNLGNSQSVSQMNGLYCDFQQQDNGYFNNKILNTENQGAYIKWDNFQIISQNASQTNLKSSQFPFKHAQMLMQEKQQKIDTLKFQEQLSSSQLIEAQQQTPSSQVPPFILNKNAKTFAKIFKLYSKHESSISPSKKETFSEYVPCLSHRRHQKKYILTQNLIGKVIPVEREVQEDEQ